MNKRTELTNNQKIIIEKKGKKVIADFFNNGIVRATTEATCHEEDKFDFEVGAKLAFTKLIEKESFLENRLVEKELLNMKFLCCSENISMLTYHKVYEVKDGKFIDNSGFACPWQKELHSEEDLKEYFSSPSESTYTYYPTKIEYIKIVE